MGLPLYRTPGRAGKVVALTFDDGPGPYSRTTVETLREHGMRATFFLCGSSVVRYPDDPAVEATVAAMGEHTWNHPELPTLGAAQARDEIARTQRIVERTSGEKVRLFRPPYGWRSVSIPELLAMDPPSPEFLRREAGRFR